MAEPGSPNLMLTKIINDETLTLATKKEQNFQRALMPYHLLLWLARLPRYLAHGTIVLTYAWMDGHRYQVI
jgi:hypothetical protein